MEERSLLSSIAIVDAVTGLGTTAGQENKPAQAMTTGTSSQSVTWTSNQSLSSNYEVTNGTTLLIDAGVTVTGNGNSIIVDNGATLTIVGASGNLVTLNCAVSVSSGGQLQMKYANVEQSLTLDAGAVVSAATFIDNTFAPNVVSADWSLISILTDTGDTFQNGSSSNYITVLANGETLTGTNEWKSIPNVTGYRMDGNLLIGSAAQPGTLQIDSGVTVDLESDAFDSIYGNLTVNQGGKLTVESSVGLIASQYGSYSRYASLIVGSGGVLTANATSAAPSVFSMPVTVQSGGALNAQYDQFSSLTLNAGAVVTSTSMTHDTFTFNSVSADWSLLGLFAGGGNVFQNGTGSNYITVLANGETLTGTNEWKSIPNVTGYRLDGNLLIGSTGQPGSLQIDSGNTVDLEPDAFDSIYGNLNVNQGGTLTVESGVAIIASQYGSYSRYASLTVGSGGVLTANATSAAPSVFSMPVTVQSGGALNAQYDQFSNLTLDAGAVVTAASLTHDTFTFNSVSADWSLLGLFAGGSNVFQNGTGSNYITVLANGETLTGTNEWKSIPNVTGYRLDGNLSIGSAGQAGSLQIDSGNTVDLEPDAFDSIYGNLNVNQGGTLTVESGVAIIASQYGSYSRYASLIVGSGGVLTANATSAAASVFSMPVTVQSGGALNAQYDQFSSLTLNAGAVVTAASLTHDTFTFNSVSADWSLVGLFAGASNVFQNGTGSNYITVLANGETLTGTNEWKSIPNVTGYRLNGNLSIGSAAQSGSLKIDSGNTVDLESDAFDNVYGNLNVNQGGTLIADGVAIIASQYGAYGRNVVLYVATGGTLNARNATVSLPTTCAVGSKGFVEESTFTSSVTLSVDSSSTIRFERNDFSQIAEIYVAGSNATAFNLSENYWGSTNPSTIVKHAGTTPAPNVANAVQPDMLGGTVWADANNNGVWDFVSGEEAGIKGVTVNLWDLTTKSFLLSQVQTDGNGDYSFVIPQANINDAFSVIFGLPSNYADFTKQHATDQFDDSNVYQITAGPAKFGTTDAVGLNGSPFNFTVDAGLSTLTQATVAITANNVTYNGTSYKVSSATVTGAGSQTIATLGDPSLSYLYYVGNLTAAQLSSATALLSAPQNVGTYTVVAIFNGGLSKVGGYANAISAPVTFTIAQQSPVLTLTPASTTIIGNGAVINASAALTSASGAAGSITFTLYDPSNTVVDTETVNVTGNGTYSATGIVPTVAGTYQWVASYSGDSNDQATSTTKGNSPTTVVGPGLTAVGTTLYAVGTNGIDRVSVQPYGAKTDGSTGLSVMASINNGAFTTQIFTQSFTSINYNGLGGNDTFFISSAIKIATTVYEGGGNNTITLGSGNSSVIVGNGNNVVVGGLGTDSIAAGNGNSLIVGGLGQHTIRVGNGSNILIDGNVKLTQTGDSLAQVLSDWTTKGAQTANLSSIRSRLSVTDNTSYPNSLQAGTGLDWFWFTDTQDTTNIKTTDVLN